MWSFVLRNGDRGPDSGRVRRGPFDRDFWGFRKFSLGERLSGPGSILLL